MRAGTLGRMQTEDGLGVLDNQGDPAAESTPRRAKKRRGAGFVLLMACVLVLVSILAVGGFYAGRALSALGSIDRQEDLNPVDYEGRPPVSTPKAAEPGEEPAKAPVNFVLLGSDSRGEGDSGRSDSLMLAHVSGDREHVYLISFPRDMWVDIPGRGKAKINAAYAYGGPALTVRTLEQLTNTRMDHTVQIDFEGFIKLTDAIGGVTVYNPWTTEQQAGNRYEEGEIHLQGERALGYVRERYQLPNGDLDRAYRQRTVVKAIIRKILTPETIANPARFSDVVGKIADTMSVDESMTNGYVTDLALSMRLTGTDGVRLLQAPIKGFATIGGQSVDVVDQAGIAELSAALSGDTMDEYFVKHQADGQDQLGEVEPPE